MINYDCKTIVLALLKKWYIILILMLVFGGISIPLANASYKRAVDNYNQLSAATESPALYDVTATYGVSGQQKESMYVYLACLKYGSFMQKVCDFYDAGTQWGELSALMEYAYEENTHTFWLTIDDAQEETADFLVNAVTVYLPEYLESNNFCEITLSERKYLKSESPKGEDAIVAGLVAEPGAMKSQSRVIIAGVILGAAVGCVIILVHDYVAKSKKVNCGEKANDKKA